MDIICDSLHIIMSGLKYVDILMAFVFQDCINNKYHKCLPLGVPWGTLHIETNWGHLGDLGICLSFVFHIFTFQSESRQLEVLGSAPLA